MSIFAHAIDSAVGVMNAVFAVDCLSISLVGSEAVTGLTGIFDPDHQLIEELDGVPVQTVRPVLSLRKSMLAESGLADIDNNARITIPGKGVYGVSEVIDDGEAEVRLVLRSLSDA